MSERILITQVERDTQANHAHLYGRGHQWPDLRLFDLSDLIDVEIHPDDLEPGKPVSCRFWAHYTLSEKLNAKGNPYRDVIALEPITAPASTTSTDTSAIVAELRAIRAMLSSALGAPGPPALPTSTPNAAPPAADDDPDPIPNDPAPANAEDETSEIPSGPLSDADIKRITDAATTGHDATLLQYADGSLVSHNEQEQATFRGYVLAESEIPQSLAGLRAWYIAANEATDSA